AERARPPELAVVADREAVRLIAKLLEEQHPGRALGEHDRLVSPRPEDPLAPERARRADHAPALAARLRDRGEVDALDRAHLEDLLDGVELRLAAVEEDEVGQVPLLLVPALRLRARRLRRARAALRANGSALEAAVDH